MRTEIAGLADLFNFVRTAHFEQRDLILPGQPELAELSALVKRIILVRATYSTDQVMAHQWIVVPVIVMILALTLGHTVACSASEGMTEETMHAMTQQLVGRPIELWGTGALKYHISRESAQVCIDYATVVWHMPSLKII